MCSELDYVCRKSLCTLDGGSNVVKWKCTNTKVPGGKPATILEVELQVLLYSSFKSARVYKVMSNLGRLNTYYKPKVSIKSGFPHPV